MARRLVFSHCFVISLLLYTQTGVVEGRQQMERLPTTPHT